jgi:glycosyltransferase involved in cell wall biosynthesis
MRIAFVSYEYPPDTGIGGIATYVFQVASLLSARSIYVDVICGSGTRNGSERVNDFLNVHRIQCNKREAFREMAPAFLKELHQKNKIDIVEAPEFGAEGLFIKDHLPGVPLVIKLHTPSFLIKELNDQYYNAMPLRKIALRFKKRYRFTGDLEYQAILKADHILSPSLSLGDLIANRWNLDRKRIIHAPNPYMPNPSFLSIPLSENTTNVLYLGRLETRKGVQEFAKAIPLIIKQKPDVHFTFLGKDSPGPLRETSMKAVITKHAGKDASTRITFIDQVPLQEIPVHMSTAAVCVFPSIWENFPNVCLEAMSAARGIVASMRGGMHDMLHDIKGGILVDPFDKTQMAGAVTALLNDPKKRNEMAERSRNKIINYYSSSLVDDLVSLYRSFV